VFWGITAWSCAEACRGHHQRKWLYRNELAMFDFAKYYKTKVEGKFMLIQEQQFNFVKEIVEMKTDNPDHEIHFLCETDSWDGDFSWVEGNIISIKKSDTSSSSYIS
jgi:hypothetical protein